jgi:LmbE family N-acetylglucosaminyl deacetylase
VPRDGDDFAQAVKTIARLATIQGCATIVATWQHDPHGDHEATHAIARQAARLCGVRLVSYPVWGWLLAEDTALPIDLLRGWRLDISRHLATKKRALAAHRSQYGNFIRDDPSGFQLPPSLLAIVDQPFEVFLQS